MIQCFKWFIYQELSGFRNHSNGTWYLSSHVINMPSLIYLSIQIKSLKCCILYFVSLVTFNLDDLIRFWSTFWSNSQMFWWQTDMWVNRPVAGISEYTSPKSHNILFCNRNVCTRIGLLIYSSDALWGLRDWSMESLDSLVSSSSPKLKACSASVCAVVGVTVYVSGGSLPTHLPTQNDTAPRTESFCVSSLNSMILRIFCP